MTLLTVKHTRAPALAQRSWTDCTYIVGVKHRTYSAGRTRNGNVAQDANVLCSKSCTYFPGTRTTSPTGIKEEMKGRHLDNPEDA